MISKKVIYLIAILSFQFLTINFLSAQTTEEKTESTDKYKVVEEMPRFPGCEDQGLSPADLKACSEKKMLEFLYGNLTYPKVARENGVEGRVIVQFVIDRDGSIIDSKIVRNVAGGCGEEVLRIVNSMPKWRPGMQKGKPVKVQYTLPLTFKLEGKKKKKKKRWGKF